VPPGESPPSFEERRPAGELGELRALLDTLGPLELVVLRRASVEAVLASAVKRGRLTSRDADELLAELMEQAREGIEIAAIDARRSLRPEAALEGAVGPDAAAPAAAVAAGEPALPILGYDDLTAAQIALRLPALSQVELRDVRDHERRHGNRKSVLAAIEQVLE
jgi:hypothetical protein